MKTQSNEMGFGDFEDLTDEELVLASGGCRRQSRRSYRGQEEEMIQQNEGLAGRSEPSPEAFSISTRTRTSMDGITVRVRISSPSGITRT